MVGWHHGLRSICYACSVRRCLLLCVIVSALIAGAAQAQEAIVLSGGGSRGLAHAGALVGLRQRNHDPDIVLGTSMGAIVGALYAAGYEPDSIWNLLILQDWRGMFTPLPAPFGPERTLRYPVFDLRSQRGAIDGDIFKKVQFGSQGNRLTGE